MGRGREAGAEAHTVVAETVSPVPLARLSLPPPPPLPGSDTLLWVSGSLKVITYIEARAPTATAWFSGSCLPRRGP